MNKRLSESGIEYLDYQWGIFSGCQNYLLGICDGGGIEDGEGFNCWARSIANRFPNHYPDGFEPHYYPEAINSPMHLKKSSIIGVGWVGDIIGYGLEHREEIFDTIYNCPQHTFLFLTKNPEKLPMWSPFPDNCWVGVTATNQKAHNEAVAVLSAIKANVKFISHEPLLEHISLHEPYSPEDAYDWDIIGSQTKPCKLPRIEWVTEIIEAADKAGIKVFLKDNLSHVFVRDSKEAELHTFQETFAWALNSESRLRQEVPC